MTFITGNKNAFPAGTTTIRSAVPPIVPARNQTSSSVWPILFFLQIYHELDCFYQVWIKTSATIWLSTLPMFYQKAFHYTIQSDSVRRAFLPSRSSFKIFIVLNRYLGICEVNDLYCSYLCISSPYVWVCTNVQIVCRTFTALP